jgi:hypothetical protein
MATTRPWLAPHLFAKSVKFRYSNYNDFAEKKGCFLRLNLAAGTLDPASSATRSPHGLCMRPMQAQKNGSCRTDDYRRFSSKRHRKGKRLVQVRPVSDWIWGSWNGPQSRGLRQTLTTAPPKRRARPKRFRDQRGPVARLMICGTGSGRQADPRRAHSDRRFKSAAIPRGAWPLRRE